MADGRMKRRTYPVANGDVIAQWLRAHPDEYLTIEDMETKFDLTELAVRRAITRARSVIGIERVSVYRLARPLR